MDAAALPGGRAFSRACLHLAIMAVASLNLVASSSAAAQPVDDSGSPGADTVRAGTCIVLYDLNATFQITDTPFGAGDETYGNLDGMLVLRFTANDADAITDGPVEILHFWMHQAFQITGIVTLTTDVHAFSPSCNGETKPSWRLPTDPGFPSVCAYSGNTGAIATGSLNRRKNKITWSPCNAAHTYWSDKRKGDGSYQQSHVSKGKGCIDTLRWVGNMHCSGLCGLGSPDRGDNPVFDVWTQPLIHGPESTGINTVAVSPDRQASTITTPTSAPSGYQSYNVPNDDRSRTWMSWVATRRDATASTTCK